VLTKKLKLRESALKSWTALNKYLVETKPVDAQDVLELYEREKHGKQRKTFLNRLAAREASLKLKSIQNNLDK
jgi:hypothetical protein